MVYVGKSGAVPDDMGGMGDGTGRGRRETDARDEGGEGSMKLPPEYRGTAFDRNGEPRAYGENGNAAPDGLNDPNGGHGDPLRHAEELFRRGYVFDDENVPSTAAGSAVGTASAVRANSGDSAARADDRERGRDAPPTADRPVSAAEKKRGDAKTGVLGNLFSGLFGSIGAEEILIGAIILMLLVNGGDDELLIMLVILLFC